MDLDGDGYVDMISGSWPGEIFFFKSGPNHTFAAPVMLKDKTGVDINIGGGMQERPDGSLYITGNATFEHAAEGDYVTYRGKRIKSTAEKPVLVTGTAAAVHAVDWNGDGKIDLLVGDIRGNVYLIPNEGTAKAYSFGKERALTAGGKPVHVEGDAGPFVADWDGDGKLDLLVGSADGSVTFYRNISSSREPELAAGATLVAASKGGWENPPKTPQPGLRTKICAVDWNGDGRLDLLVGDMAILKPERPKPTAAQKAEQDKAQKEMDVLTAKYRTLFPKIFGATRVKTEADLKKVQAEWKEVREKMTQVQSKLPEETETHGWVWLYLRKAPETRTAAILKR